MLWMVQVSKAQVGISNEIHRFDQLGPYHNGFNVSLTYAEPDPGGAFPSSGKYWIAAEARTNLLETSYDQRPRITLLMYDTVTSSWLFKETPVNRLTNPTNDPDLASAMYSSVVTGPYNGEDWVWLSAKENINGHTYAQLEVFKQRRDDFGQSWNFGSPAATTDEEHGRSHLTIDPNGSDTTYLCWTTRKPAGADPLDDTTSVAHELGDTWGGASVKVIRAYADRIDDHCSQAVAESGDRTTVYHTVQVNASGQPLATTHNLFLDIDHYDAATNSWATTTNDLLLPLPTVSGATQRPDFPVLYEDAGKLVIVAQDLTNPEYLLWWTCDVFATGCNVATEWTTGAYNPPGQVYQPQAARFGGSVYAVWENGGPGDIGVGAWCSGGAGWTYFGIATDLTNIDRYEFGVLPGSATRTLVFDDIDEYLVATWLGRRNAVGYWNPIWWKFADPC